MSHTAIVREAYASPLRWQTFTFPKGLLLSLQIAGTIIIGKDPIFPADIKRQIVIDIVHYFFWQN